MKTIGAWRDEVRPGWALVQRAYEAEAEGRYETLLTLTNGYFGCRGNLELASARRQPGVYLAGVYDKPDRPEESDAFGLTVRNKAITPAYAVAPLWNLVELTVNGEPVDFLNADVASFERVLDMRRGLLISRYELTDARGGRTRLGFVSAALLTDRHQWVMRCEVEPLNYSGRIEIRFACEQPVTPQYIPRLKDYISHTDYLGGEANARQVQLNGRVAQTGADLWLVCASQSDDGLARRVIRRPTGMAEAFSGEVASEQVLRFSRRCAIAATPEPPALSSAAMDKLLDDHAAAWDAKWDAANFEFDGDDRVLTGLRWDMFSLHALGHFHCPDYSISATGLHGQGYFGHVFWDTDIFMMPFYLMTSPETARDLLLYRYRRLDAARQVAREHGYRGAKFPWTSAGEGLDVCPPDWERCGRRQVHISGDVAYAFDLYRQWTGDQAFFEECGIEVVVETARFFRSRMTEGDDGRLHLLDVIGPDEYNIHANDNYYTNYLAQWNLRRAVEAMTQLRQRHPQRHDDLAACLGWSDAEADRLSEAADRIAFPRVCDGVYEQYDGFFDLKDVGHIRRDENNMPVEKLHAYDQGYQIIKQADAVMMLFLFPEDFSAPTQRATFDYYEQRNSFGSSLSPSISCAVGLRLGMGEHAYGYFRLTTLLDVEDLHIDRNTHEGIHAACAGGTAIAAFWGFGGTRVVDGDLRLKPTLAPQWSRMEMRLSYRGDPVRVIVDADGARCTIGDAAIAC